MIVIGCDPGLKGAISVVEGSGVEDIRAISVFSVPIAKEKTVSAKTILYRLGKALDGRVADAIVIEQPFVVPGQGIQSTFTFGEVFGALKAVLGLAPHQKMVTVKPSVWKRDLGLSKNKKDSISLAKRLFASSKYKISNSHDKAESLLIAAWWMLLPNLSRNGFDNSHRSA